MAGTKTIESKPRSYFGDIVEGIRARLSGEQGHNKKPVIQNRDLDDGNDAILREKANRDEPSVRYENYATSGRKLDGQPPHTGGPTSEILPPMLMPDGSFAYPAENDSSLAKGSMEAGSKGGNKPATTKPIAPPL